MASPSPIKNSQLRRDMFAMRQGKTPVFYYEWNFKIL